MPHKRLQEFLKNVFNNNQTKWNEFSREAERLLNKTNDPIKHKFLDSVVPSDIMSYLKSSMPRSCTQEIDRTCKNVSSIRAATMLIEKVFHYDDSFYYFLEALFKNKQGSLVEDLVNSVASNKPNLRFLQPEQGAVHRSLHTPHNTQHNSYTHGSPAQSSENYASQAQPVDDLVHAQHPASAHQQQSVDTSSMMSNPTTIDGVTNNNQPSASHSLAQMSTMNQGDLAIRAAGSKTSTIGGMQLSAARTVDQQVLAEKDRQIQQLQQQYQQLQNAVVTVHGSMDNFHGRVRSSIPHESAEPQAGEFTSADFDTNRG